MAKDTASRVNVFDDLRRTSVKTNLAVRRLLDHFGIPSVTEAEVDEELARRDVTPSGR
ncbi:hypothetical protein ACFWY5_20145 [Nonomuraea sp. NPDC059007]|uniref:hypothetical protein n=1 Tax=Nonomuraea sp. NPDC059007 TaxID=3346692 RepID=UPI003687A34B